VTSDNGCIGFDAPESMPTVVNREDASDIPRKLQSPVRPMLKLQ
jgi:hypothetical protein